jgi:hypothetical protein
MRESGALLILLGLFGIMAGFYFDVNVEVKIDNPYPSTSVSTEKVANIDKMMTRSNIVNASLCVLLMGTILVAAGFAAEQVSDSIAKLSQLATENKETDPNNVNTNKI